MRARVGTGALNTASRMVDYVVKSVVAWREALDQSWRGSSCAGLLVLLALAGFTGGRLPYWLDGVYWHRQPAPSTVEESHVPACPADARQH